MQACDNEVTVSVDPEGRVTSFVIEKEVERKLFLSLRGAERRTLASAGRDRAILPPKHTGITIA